MDYEQRRLEREAIISGDYRSALQYENGRLRRGEGYIAELMNLKEKHLLALRTLLEIFIETRVPEGNSRGLTGADLPVPFVELIVNYPKPSTNSSFRKNSPTAARFPPIEQLRLMSQELQDAIFENHRRISDQEAITYDQNHGVLGEDCRIFLARDGDYFTIAAHQGHIRVLISQLLDNPSPDNPSSFSFNPRLIMLDSRKILDKAILDLPESVLSPETADLLERVAVPFLEKYNQKLYPDFPLHNAHARYIKFGVNPTDIGVTIEAIYSLRQLDVTQYLENLTNNLQLSEQNLSDFIRGEQATLITNWARTPSKDKFRVPSFIIEAWVKGYFSC